MRIRLVLRRGAATRPGGDRMQAEEAAGWLCAEGWDARIVDDPKTLDAGAADVVVLMGLIRCLDWGDLPERTRAAGTRLVLWPLHHRTDRYDKEGRVGPDRLVSRVLGRGLPLQALRHRTLGTTLRSRMQGVLGLSQRILLSWPDEVGWLRDDVGPFSGETHLVPVAIGPVATIPSSEAGSAPLPAGPWIVQIGRIEPLKQPLATLEAADSLGLPVAFAGSLPRDRHFFHSLRFRTALRRLGPERARWLGPLGAQDLAALLDRAAVHVLPSWAEVAGRVTLEAAARGVPVVLSTEGHASSMLGGPGPGVHLVDPSDPDGLRAAIVRAVEEGRDPYRPVARTVRERFTWSAVGPLLRDALR